MSSCDILSDPCPFDWIDVEDSESGRKSKKMSAQDDATITTKKPSMIKKTLKRISSGRSNKPSNVPFFQQEYQRKQSQKQASAAAAQTEALKTTAPKVTQSIRVEAAASPPPSTTSELSSAAGDIFPTSTENIPATSSVVPTTSGLSSTAANMLPALSGPPNTAEISSSVDNISSNDFTTSEAISTLSDMSVPTLVSETTAVGDMLPSSTSSPEVSSLVPSVPTTSSEPFSETGGTENDITSPEREGWFRSMKQAIGFGGNVPTQTEGVGGEQVGGVEIQDSTQPKFPLVRRAALYDEDEDSLSDVTSQVNNLLPSSEEASSTLNELTSTSDSVVPPPPPSREEPRLGFWFLKWLPCF